MTGINARIKTVSREEAERIVRSSLSARRVCLWGAGTVLLPTLGLILVLAVLPFTRTRSVLGGFAAGRVSSCGAVAHLGGPRKAAERLSSYLSLPDLVAPNRAAAALLLADCGPPALEVLERALEDSSREVRTAAARALEKLRSES